MMIDKCIVCDGVDAQLLIQVEDHLLSHEIFDLHKCPECGFVYVHNPPSATEATKYYETEEYIEHSDSQEGLINQIYHKARSIMLPYKRKMLDKYDLPKKILDFGTGTGYFLNYMKEQGYDVTGIEISDQARNFGKEKFDLDIYHPDKVYDDDFPGGHSFISFWHVLEHVYDPRRILTRLRDLLIDDGVLLIALPNHRSLDARTYGTHWCAYDVPRHLWHFDADSFKRFAESCGYRLEKTKMLPLDPFYNSLISASYKKNITSRILIPFVSAASLIQGWFSSSKASSIVYFLRKA